MSRSWQEIADNLEEIHHEVEQILKDRNVPHQVKTAIIRLQVGILSVTILRKAEKLNIPFDEIPGKASWLQH
jgi:hypothetical protein